MRIYQYQGKAADGQLEFKLASFIPEAGTVTSVALGDYDGDGLLDMALGRSEHSLTLGFGGLDDVITEMPDVLSIATLRHSPALNHNLPLRPILSR